MINKFFCSVVFVYSSLQAITNRFFPKIKIVHDGLLRPKMSMVVKRLRNTVLGALLSTNIMVEYKNKFQKYKIKL